MQFYDDKTRELAEYFLAKYDVEGKRADCVRWVAQRVQKGIEDDLEDLVRDKHIVEKKK